jgi:hypothetical protein
MNIYLGNISRSDFIRTQRADARNGQSALFYFRGDFIFRELVRGRNRSCPSPAYDIIAPIEKGTSVRTFFGTPDLEFEISHFFEDADKEADPEMLADFSWPAAKRLFVENVKAYSAA